MRKSVSHYPGSETIDGNVIVTGTLTTTGAIRSPQFRATADGTSAEFAYTWDVDPNTGMRRLGADQFVLGVAGNQPVIVAQFLASFNEGILNSGGYISSSQLTPTALAGGTVNDYAPASWNGARGWIRQDVTAATTLTGLSATSAGHTAALWNISTVAANTITLKHENTSSAAANRFHLPGLMDFVLSPCEGLMMIYDGVSSRWRLVASRESSLVSGGG